MLDSDVFSQKIAMMHELGANDTKAELCHLANT
jgi:hypothetical protein